MAKAKKIIEPIIGAGKNPETQLTVQKSIPLLSLWQSDMSLAELKILDTYLSRINSRDPQKRTVIFTKGELEQLLGVKKINKSQLTARLKNLGRFIDLEDGNTRKIHQIALFEEAYGEMDENGQWTVRLTCTDKAMKYVFNIDKLGYLRYKLHSIVSLKSRYTYVLFLYLEHNRFRKSWEIDLDVLRELLSCDKDESYSAFKVFNDRILKRCQAELREKTECRFEYEPIKSGRKVTAIKFTLELLSPKIGAEVRNDEFPQITVFDGEDEESDEDLAQRENRDRRADVIGHGFDNALFDEFSDEELLELKDTAFRVVDPAEVDKINKHYQNRQESLEMATADLIARKIKAMNVYDKRNPINDRYSYLKKSIIKEEKNRK